MKPIALVLFSTILIANTAASHPSLQAQQLTVELDNRFEGTFRLGKSTTVKMAALLNLESTVVTNINCPNCQTKVYDVKTTNTSKISNYTYKSPFRTRESIEYEGQEAIESLCIPTSDGDYMCTPDSPDTKEDDYTIIVLNKFLETKDSNPQNGGLLGLSPGQKSDNTLGYYYRKMKLSDSNTVTISRRGNLGYRLSYGKVPTEANVTWAPLNRHNQSGVWYTQFTEVNMSDFTLFSNSTKKIKADITNSYPFMMFETNDFVKALNFTQVLKNTYSEITINNDTNKEGMSLISGTFQDDCKDILDKYGKSFKNLTFDTLKGQENGMIFHVNLQNLLFELTPGKCEFGLYLIYDSTFTSEKLILGNEFINSYELSFNYEGNKLGLKGYYTVSGNPVKPDDKKDEDDGVLPNSTIKMLVIAGASLIAIVIIAIIAIKMRNKRLRRELEESEPLV